MAKWHELGHDREFIFYIIEIISKILHDNLHFDFTEIEEV